jgi:hypothetical protein
MPENAFDKSRRLLHLGVARALTGFDPEPPMGATFTAFHLGMAFRAGGDPRIFTISCVAARTNAQARGGAR